MSSRGFRPSALGWGVLIAIVLLAIASIGAWAWASRPPDPELFGPLEAGPIPDFKHVYLIVLENQPITSVIGDEDAPYINGLAEQGAVATNYHSVERPSQPNYIALISGQTFGIQDDNNHDVDAPMLADQLEAAGRSWAVSAENLPDPCFTGALASGGGYAKGTYARKHEPFISFRSVSGDAARCQAHIHDLTRFDPGEADFQLIVPNLCHDAHDCPLEEADSWLAGFAQPLLESATFKHGGVLFITFDEGNRLTTQVAMIAVGTGVTPGTSWNEPRSHYAWLRTIEDAWGLPCLANACSAGNLSGLFSGSDRVRFGSAEAP